MTYYLNSNMVCVGGKILLPLYCHLGEWKFEIIHGVCSVIEIGFCVQLCCICLSLLFSEINKCEGLNNLRNVNCVIYAKLFQCLFSFLKHSTNMHFYVAPLWHL